jgi:hypothetical protein
MNMSSSGEPTRDDLRRLIDRLRPRIARLFERHGVSTAEAESRVTEALSRLSYRWDQVRDRERWLLTALKKDLVARPGESSKEPRDE